MITFSLVGAVSLLIIFAKWQARKTEEKRKEINRKSRKGRPEKLTTYEGQFTYVLDIQKNKQIWGLLTLNC